MNRDDYYTLYSEVAEERDRLHELNAELVHNLGLVNERLRSEERRVGKECC
mgnify:CR=1 FL=1